MPDETNDANAADFSSLIADLTRGGLLSDLLRDVDIRRACLIKLKEAGLPPPANHVVFHTLRHTIAAVERHSGKAIKTKLNKLLNTYEPLRKLAARLSSVVRNAQQASDFRAAVLADLHGDEANLPPADEDTPLDILVALHQNQRIEGLSEDLADLVGSIGEALDLLFDRMVAPPAHAHLTQQDPQSAADYIRFDSGKYPFIGRDAETQFLERFLGNPADDPDCPAFRWLLMTGAGGEGKSRLALWLWKKLQSPESPWQALWLTKDAPETFAGQAAQWAPRQPTLMILDYPARSPEAVGRMLGALAGQCGDYDFPVRVLLMERDAEGEWFKRAFPEGGETIRLRQLGYAETPEAEAGVWRLPAMRPKGLIDLMRRRFEDAEIEPPSSASLIGKAYEVDPRGYETENGIIPLPRPLFAAMVAEVAIRGPEEDDLSVEDSLDRIAQEDVLDRLLDRDRDQYWRPAVDGTGDDAREKLEAHENLLTLATMTQGMDLAALAELPDAVMAGLPKAQMGQRPRLDNELLGRMSGHEDGHIRPLEPDILGEHFVLRWFEHALNRDPAFAQAICNAAFARGEDTAIFILHCVRDFPARIEARGFLAPEFEGGRAAAQVWASLCVELSYRLGGARAWQALDAAWARLDDLQAAWPEDRGIAVETAEGAVSFIKHAGAAGDWTRVDAMLGRLKDLQAAWPEDQEITLVTAKCAVNIINHAGAAGDWTRVDAMLGRLKDLQAARPDDREVSLRAANGAVNAIIHAGAADEWTRVDAMLDRLKVLQAAWPDDREVSLRAVNGAVNAIKHAGAAGDWTRVDAILDRLEDVRAAWPDDREIALLAAKIAFNVIYHAAAAGDWTRIDAMLGWQEDLCAAWPDDREIAEATANGAVNAINNAGAAGEWVRVDYALGRLNDLQAAWPYNREISLLAAKIAFYVIYHAAAAGDWTRMDAMLGWQEDLCAAWPEDREIAVATVEGAINVTYHAAAAGDWTRVDAMLGRLEDLRTAWPDDREIALWAAKDAVNVTSHAGAAGEWVRVDDALGRLDDLQAEWPDDREIAVATAQGAFNVINNAGSAGERVRVDDALGRLDDLQAEWPDDREIAVEAAKGAVNITLHAGSAGEWVWVDDALGRLDDLQAEWPDDREIAVATAKCAIFVTCYAGAAGDWTRVDAVEKLCERIVAATSKKSEVMGIFGRVTAIAYILRRQAGQSPDQDVTATAAIMAEHGVTVAASEENQRLVSICLQVIQDAAARFPDDSEIAITYRAQSDAGLDWSVIPSIK